jgi:hypothetical protein
LDHIIEERQPESQINSKLLISRSRKRITELTPEEYQDAELFSYNGKMIWNGF